MFKKLVSFVSVFAITSMLAPAVLAADFNVEELINPLDLSVQNGSAQNFQPTNNQTLNTTVTFGGGALPNATGTVEVRQGAVVIKTLQTISGINPPAAFILPWDGKAIDNTAAAQGVCGTQAAACPNGDYTVFASVSSASGGNNLVDNESAGFKITTPPAVDVTSLSATPATFNPITQTTDISFGISTGGFITVEVLDGATQKKLLLDNENLTAGPHSKLTKPALEWNGKDSTGATLPNKAYTVKVTSKQTANGPVLDTDTVTVTVNTPSSITITTFNLTPVTAKAGSTTFDPSSKGDNQDLQVDYSLNLVPDSVTVEIKDPKGTIVKTMTLGAQQSGTSSWDGLYGLKLVAPGIYTAKLIATKSGSTPADSSKTFTVAYNNAGKGEIQSLTVLPDTFDPDFEDAVIEFKNSKDTNITVEIQSPANNDVVRTFSGYQDDNYSENTPHSVAWNGKDSSNNYVGLATYKAIITTRNEYGVVVSEKNIIVNNSGGSISESNAHISGISFSPSSTFEPAVDDELRITFDAEVNLDSLKVNAVRGSTKIELFNETDVEEENNIEINWNGQDNDDEYVAKGSWKITFESKVGSTTLMAAKSVTVDYEKPMIDDLYISKSKFDPDKGEFIYVVFRVDLASNVTLKVLEGSDEQDDIVEDMEVEADKWYAVLWDGENYNYDDDIDIKLIAQNTANKDVFDSDKISVDLAEDKVSGSKSNITQDYIEPVITGGNESMTIYYNLEDDADLTVTIHKGESGSGSKVIQLAAIDEQESGSHSVTWNGKDDNQKKLSSGIYSYKIVSGTNSGTDTETGLFFVGTVGDTEGGSGSSDSGSSVSGGGNTSPNVIVDGGSGDVVDVEFVGSFGEDCAGFSDVSGSSKQCAAIEWVKSANIFQGYNDGTFGAYKPINRAELLKVILEAFDIQVPASVSGVLGFNDVVVGAWYMPYFKAAKDKGIFQGDAGKGTARPSDTSNRVESLKMIFETMKNVGLLGQIGSSCQSFPDVSSNAWYQIYACQADAYDLFVLSKGENFYPGLLSTRGEIAEIFYKLHLMNLI